MRTYTDVLKENGYTCALAGKWHLGDSLVPQHGFDRWFTIGRGGCYYYKADVVENGTIHFENRYITDVITDKALGWLAEFQGQEEPFYLSVHYTAPHDPWDEDQHPKEYVEMYRDCGFTATPDLPIHPNQIESAPYGTGEVRKSLLRGYYAAITAMDANIGGSRPAGGAGHAGGYHRDFHGGQRHEYGAPRNLGQGKRHLPLQYV